MEIYLIENIKNYVLSYLRNSSYRSQVEEYFDNALYYARHGREYQARDQVMCAAHFLDAGGPDEKKMANYIRNSI